MCHLLGLRYKAGFRKEAAHHLLACVGNYCILELFSNGESEYHLLLQFVSVHFCQFVPQPPLWSFQIKSCICSSGLPKQLLSEQHLKMWSLHYIPFCSICVGIIRVPYERFTCFLPLLLFCIFLCLWQLVLPSLRGSQQDRGSSPITHNHCSSCFSLGFQFLQVLCFLLPCLA